MDKPNNQVPRAFDREIFAALGELERILYFHWDLTTDVMEFDNPRAGRIYALPDKVMHNASSALWVGGLIHRDDVRLLHRFMKILYQPTRENSSVHKRRLPAKLRLRSRNGDGYIWVNIHTLVYFEKGRPTALFGTVRNIQAQKKWERKMEQQAECDHLTGLLNKEGMKNSVSNYLDSISPKLDRCALLLIDADGFKDINDTFGHLFGDAVLTDMGLAIEGNFRDSDLKGRIGGDEFVVLFRNLRSTDVLEDRCEALIRNLSRTYEDNGHSLNFSISIGAALYPDHGTNYTELFRRADRALYEAKGNGKNQLVLYRPSLLGSVPLVKNSRDPQSFEDFQQKAFKDNMLEFIFRLLYETNSSRATIELTLGMFGKQFNFDRVAVDRYDKKANQYTNAYEWLSPRGISMHPARDNDRGSGFELRNLKNQMVLSLYHPMSYGVVSICRNTSLLDVKYQPAIDYFRVGAFAHCLITHGFDTIGCFGFECQDAHDFTQEELNDLHTFCVLLGNILLPQESDTRTREENEHLRDLLDHMQEMIYIVDRETMVPVYVNQTIRQTLSDSSSEEPCYMRFHHLDAPCKDCPAQKLTGAGYEYLEQEMHSWGCLTYTRACNLTWKHDGHPVMLVIQKPS